MKTKTKAIIWIAAILLFGCFAFAGKELYSLNTQLNALKIEYNNLNKKYNKIEKENDKNKKELEYYKSDEYVESIKLSKMSDLTGLEVTDYYAQDFVFTYYTTLASENGGYTTTCTGETLRDGMVASNYYPLGTKLYIDGKVYVVADKGSSRFDSPKRLDVLVGKNSGESDSSYLRRVNNMGVSNKNGYVLTTE